MLNLHAFFFKSTQYFLLFRYIAHYFKLFLCIVHKTHFEVILFARFETLLLANKIVL